jgi:hypothetical protein
VGELLSSPVEQCRERIECTSPLTRCRTSPGGQSLACGRDCGVDVAGIREVGHGHHVAGGRINDVVRASGAADPLTADVLVRLRARSCDWHRRFAHHCIVTRECFFGKDFVVRAA